MASVSVLGTFNLMVNLVFWYDMWSRPCTLGHTRARLAGLDRPVRDARGLEMPLVAGRPWSVRHVYHESVRGGIVACLPCCNRKFPTHCCY